MTAIASLLGGVGLFLLGMSMMTDGLKVAAGDALRSILQDWTRSSLRGLAVGALITGVVQSSSAVTVATVGFVNAGLLTLAQAVWVVFGANVGTSMTGWLVALVGVKLDIEALALPLLGIGMVVRLAAAGHVARAGLGQAIAGFGAFFLGIGILQEGFIGLTPLLAGLDLGDDAGVLTTLGFLGLGVLLTVVTQSSSAAVAIALTATAGGAAPLGLAAATVVGTNIGTTSTAIFASVGATAPARRVALAHIAFNLTTGAVALTTLPLLLAASREVADALGLDGGSTATLAVFHTLFNCLGVVLAWPFAARFVRWLETLYVTVDEEIGKPRHLDPTLAAVPSIALRAVELELARMMNAVFSLAQTRIEGPRASPRDYVLRRDGVMRLGEAIREYLGRMNAHQLPADVVQALPDLIRTIQHLEEIATLAGDIDMGFLPPRLDVTGDEWAALGASVREALRIRSNGGEAAETARAALAGRIETAYQQLKGELLAASAEGRISVPAMEKALLHAQRLRRCGETALKALRRFGPWMAVCGGGEGSPSGPASATT